MMTFSSLFAGIGGFDLGLEHAGMSCVWQVEIDLSCQQVLTRHWPDVERYSDVRECGAHNLRAVDVICGGFPCQPHSIAGRRLASADERDLWGEFYRIICELGPRWVVAENVGGLLSSEDGRFFGRILRDLADGGYDAEWDCIPASAFDAPHRRYRIFIVAYPTSRRCKDVSIFTWGTCGRIAAEDSTWNRGILTRDSGGRIRRIPDSGVCRVADGLPGGVDRLRALGNAVVPQVAEWIGQRIIDVEAR